MQIGVRNQSTDAWTMLETEGVTMELTLSASDISDITARKASHSLNIRLPFTPTNDRFFGHVSEVDIDNPTSYDTFDITKKTEGQVLDNGIPVMEGVLKMLSIDLAARKYECVFFSEAANLFENIRGKGWEDIFRDSAGEVSVDLDHEFTAANVIDSWTLTNDITNGSVGAGIIVYPLSDYGTGGSEDQPATSPMYANIYQSGGTSILSGMFNPDHLTSRSQKPAIQCRYLLDKIVEFGGYTVAEHGFVDSADSNFANLYMQLGTESVFAVGRSSNGFKVGLSGDRTMAPINAGTLSFLNFDNEGSTFYDPDNHVYGGNFLVPFTGYFWFGLYFRVYSSSGVGTFELKIVIEKNGEEYLQETRTVSYNTTYHWGQEFAVYAEESDMVSCRVAAYNAITVTIKMGNFTYWKMHQYNSYSPNSPTCNVIGNMPRGSIDKWLGAIMDKFNLVMTTDDETKEVTFSPWPDYIVDSSVTKDWSKKVDRLGSMILRPTTDYQNSRVEFADTDGTDRYNSWFQTFYGRGKGATTFYSPSDFSVGVKEVGGYFRPYRQALLKAEWLQETMLPSVAYGLPTNIVWSEQWENWDGGRLTVATGEPMLMFYHGPQSIVLNTGVSSDLYIDSTTFSTFPLFTTNSSEPATTTDYTLDFGPDVPDIVASDLVGIPGRTSAQKFWLEFLDELYNPSSRTLECSALLTAYDISSLKFNDKIFIDGTIYRVLEISNYQVGERKPCNLKLMKSLTASDSTCGLIPTIEESGEISWVSAETGAAQTSNALCCRKWGYTWNAATSECTWVNGPVDGPDGSGSRGMTGDYSPPPLVPGAVVRGFGSSVKMGKGEVHKFTMNAQTVGTAVAEAKTALGQTAITLPPEKIAGIKVNYISNISSGANRGDSTYGENVFAIRTVDLTGGKVSTGTGQIYAKGSVSGTDLDVVVTSGDTTSFVLEATGVTGENLDWFITVEVMLYDADYQTFDEVFADAAWENEDRIMFNDNDMMSWN